MVTVEQLWAIYVASVIFLSLIAVLISRVGKMHVGIGIFVAVLLASVITYLVAITNIDIANLEQGAKNSLQSLYWVIIIVIILAFALMFYLEWTTKKKPSSEKKTNFFASMWNPELEEEVLERELEDPLLVEVKNGKVGLNLSPLRNTKFSYLS